MGMNQPDHPPWRYSTWQYNGLAPIEEIIKWCRTAFGHDNNQWHYPGHESIYFEREQDYAWFLLRWQQ